MSQTACAKLLPSQDILENNLTAVTTNNYALQCVPFHLHSLSVYYRVTCDKVLSFKLLRKCSLNFWPKTHLVTSNSFIFSRSS